MFSRSVPEPSGDCGATLSAGAAAIAADLPSYPLRSASGTAAALAGSVRRSMGGSSGVLYDIFFTAASAAVLGGAAVGKGGGAKALAAGLSAGAAAISRRVRNRAPAATRQWRGWRCKSA